MSDALVKPGTRPDGFVKSTDRPDAFYVTWRNRVNAVCSRLYTLAAENTEVIPQQGGALLAMGPHTGFLDPAFVGISVLDHTDRPVRFLTNERYLHTPVLGKYLRQFGVIPVQKDNSQRAGRSLVAAARRIRDDGSLVGIFPDGTRRNKLGEFEQGVGFLAQHSRVPVIPVGMDGGLGVWPRERWFPARGEVISLHFGTPISPDEISSCGSRESVTALVRERIVECVEQAKENRARLKADCTT